MPTDDSLHTYLADLPTPAPPATLWPKLEHARTRRLRRQRIGVGMAGLAMLAVLAVPLLQSDPDAPTTATSATADGAPPAMAVPPRADAARDAVRALDRALQAAYARGASDQELAPLWSARKAALTAARDAANFPLRS